MRSSCSSIPAIHITDRRTLRRTGLDRIQPGPRHQPRRRGEERAHSGGSRRRSHQNLQLRQGKTVLHRVNREAAGSKIAAATSCTKSRSVARATFGDGAMLRPFQHIGDGCIQEVTLCFIELRSIMKSNRFPLALTLTVALVLFATLTPGCRRQPRHRATANASRPTATGHDADEAVVRRAHGRHEESGRAEYRRRQQGQRGDRQPAVVDQPATDRIAPPRSTRFPGRFRR